MVLSSFRSSLCLLNPIESHGMCLQTNISTWHAEYYISTVYVCVDVFGCVSVYWIFNMDSMHKKKKPKQSVETGNINLNLAEQEILIHSIAERDADIRIFTNKIVCGADFFYYVPNRGIYLFS